MAAFRRFEEINAWQIGRELNRRIYAATSNGAFGRDFALRDQIRRASISVSSNIAEGYARRSRADFARFLTIARASAAEVNSQLYLALDLDYLSKNEFDELLELSHRVGAACGGLIRYLRSPDTTSVSESTLLWEPDSEPLNPEL